MASRKQELLSRYLDKLRGESPSGGYKTVNLTAQEITHIQDLRRKFLEKFNESYSTGKTFKNPLSNSDMAWLYKMASKERRTTVDDYFFLADKHAEPFLLEIDECLKELRNKKIPISGETATNMNVKGDENSSDIQERRAARQILDAAAGSKTISKDDLKKAISLYAGAQATKEEKVTVGSKVLDFLKKKQIKLST